MARARRYLTMFGLLIYGILVLVYYFHTYTTSDGQFRYQRWLDGSFVSNDRRPKLRVLCAIMTIPANHKTKAAAVRDTWARRCDRVLYFTSGEQPRFVANDSLVIVNVSEGRDSLWLKTRTAFLHMEDTYGREFDWFLKSDDDTYFIIDNLRSFLAEHDPNAPVWFGCEFVHHTSKQRFPSGGAGYVLSRGAMRAFARAVFNETTHTDDELSTTINSSSSSPRSPVAAANPAAVARGCGTDGGQMGEDVRFSVCLESASVSLIDARGANDSYRFLPTMLEHFVYPERNGGNGWMTMYRSKHGQGIHDCCDSRLISIHYANPKLMYTYEFLIHHLKVNHRI